MCTKFSDDSYIANLTTTNGGYPFGVQTWTIQKDGCMYNNSNSYVQKTLHVSVCDIWSDYNCQLGDCIPLRMRCDGKVDCIDDSSGKLLCPALFGFKLIVSTLTWYLDEDDCGKVVFSDSYSNVLPPSGEILEENKEALAASILEVSLAARLMNLLDIDEKRSMVTMQVKLILSWKDSRLQYQNLEDDRTKNILLSDEIDKV